MRWSSTDAFRLRYFVLSPESNTIYYFRVRAVNELGEGEPGEVACLNAGGILRASMALLLALVAFLML